MIRMGAIRKHCATGVSVSSEKRSLKRSIPNYVTRRGILISKRLHRRPPNPVTITIIIIMTTTIQLNPTLVMPSTSIPTLERRIIMKHQTTFKAPSPRTAYEGRPWLKHYPSYIPPQLTTRFANGLEMFLETAKAMPEQAAIYYFDQSMSYSELDNKSTALAAALQGRGVTHGDRVALYLQNIPQFLIALYGAWKVGAIVVPCNPMFKQRELEYHLNDSGAKGLICLESLYETIARDIIGNTKVEFVITTSELDIVARESVPALLASSSKQRFDETLDLLELLAQFDGANIQPATFTPADVAFLTYTSGTTGRPKGAMNTHGNVVFNATFYQQWMQLDSNDVVIGVAPFFHITGLIAHLAVASLASMPIIMFYRFYPAETLRLIEKWRGSFTVAAITVFIALLNHRE